MSEREEIIKKIIINLEEKKIRKFFPKNLWIEPVQTIEDLPLVSKEYSICFCKSNKKAYIYVSGSWQSYLTYY